MARKDPLPTYAYALYADGMNLGFMKQATFPTTTSFIFEADMWMAKPFLDSLKDKGAMRYRRWSLVILNTALEVVLRYVWGQTSVTRIGFPGLENQSPKLPHFSIECAVAGVEEASPNGAGPAHSSAFSLRVDPLPFFAIQTKIDGLDAAEWAVSKVGAFKLGEAGFGDLVLASTPEQYADPFRSWLSSGNSHRAGSLNLLNTALQPFFSLGFTGLRVRTVTPAFTTDSPGPATIRLAYSSISFGLL